MVVGFDHEEVGSQSMVGADSKTLEYWLRSALYGVQAGSRVDDKVSLTRAVRTSDQNLNFIIIIFALTFFLTTRDNLQFAYPLTKIYNREFLVNFSNAVSKKKLT